jgi:hypothetical protein
MALCSKCEKEVPSSAWSCPNCGEPISHNENSAPAIREDSTSPAMAKKQQMIYSKIPYPIKKLLFKFQQNPMTQIIFKKISHIPQSIKMVGVLLCLVVLAGTAYTIFSDKLTLKNQAADFVEARNRILLETGDTNAMGIVAKNTAPDYKKKYLDELLFTDSKSFNSEDSSKNNKVTAELQSIQIDDDKQHAIVNYRISVPANHPTIKSSDQQHPSLENGILQLKWVKLDGKWYFNGEKITE